MPNLTKAKIYEITSGDTPQTKDDGIDVQFNPESLSFSLSNRIEGGRSSGRQVRQFVGSSSNVFSLDLEFDTSDEGSTDEPISVLERTSFLDKFISPKTKGKRSSEQPAKLRFHWGHMIIDGIVENIDIELDHFAQNGYPLHAKVTLKLKEQKIEFQFAERGGSSDDTPAEDSSQVAQALDDESPSQAASRLGLNPANWRDLGFDLSLGLSLEAGLELNFEAGISASIGVDVKAGVNADIDLDLAASLGLQAGAALSVPHLANDSRPKQDLSAGLALAKAGGIASATNLLAKQNAEIASLTSVSAFDLGGVAGVSLTKQSGAGLAVSNPSSSLSVVSFDRNSTSLKIPPDTRATTFGFSVPLQNKRVPILDQQQALRASAKTLDISSSSTAGRTAADLIQTRRRPGNRCGCQSACKH